MATIAPVKFLGEVRDELNKVTWPKKDDIVRLTLLVIFVSVLVGLYIGALDFIFTKSMEIIVK